MSFNELCNDFNINQRQSERILNIINNYFITKLNDDSTTSDVYEDEILAILGQSNNIDYHICQYILQSLFCDDNYLIYRKNYARLFYKFYKDTPAQDEFIRDNILPFI